MLHSLEASKNISDKKKGDDFEHYILNLFDNKSGQYKLLEWRGYCRASNGMYPHNNILPDLEFAFKSKNLHNKFFAIECKWRQKFTNGKLAWATTSQIDIYLKYQNEKNIPVFIAIGVGGNPSCPEKLFITPLNNIHICPEVSEHQLIPYKRDPNHRLVYNVTQLKLFSNTVSNGQACDAIKAKE